ncbi:hypothetical protein Hanom_Chr09g00778601 [Helianthus anomalus]
MKPLLDAINKTGLNTPTSSLSPITKGMPLHVTRPSLEITAHPQENEGTPLVSQVTLGGFSSEATTIAIETTISQLDNGYIAKTSLKATTSTILHSLSIGSPQNQEQGHLVQNHVQPLLVGTQMILLT